MPLFNSRNKSITFRLSSEEYEELKNYCVAKKIRSISDLARNSIILKVHHEEHARHNLISGDLTALGSALSEIDGALKALSAKISKVLGPK